MKRTHVKSPSLFGFWPGVGLTSGVLFGMAIGNFPIGIIAGFCGGLILGKAAHRMKMIR